ncbi:MAG: right-handed parallel beta-helix repeat-containing protein [Acidobacteria bacterium]|nr:right-handed parallel beta-helix repeat-containing protein [Acidobacteriota bacterium]
MNRRKFLSATTLSAALPQAAALLPAADTPPQPPPVTRPRATFGDAVEPDWQQRLKITVGPQKADLVGSDHRVIQAAVDYVAGLGGGTVEILPGTYRFRNAVQLRTGTRVIGSGEDSVCIKEPSIKTALAENSDWYDREVTLTDASGFQVGDGIVLRTKNPNNGSFDTFKRTLIARSGNRFKLNEMLVENFWTKEGATAARLFSLFEGNRIADAAVENICLDGNRNQNEFLNGNYVGCIFLRESNRIHMRNVIARNFNGDGISWQVCHDVRVENCRSHDNAGYGLHPGSGSQRTVVTGCELHRNDIGFFFCWGVKWGLVERNTMADNKRFGVSIGHNDTDNVVRNNEVLRSGKTGIFLRQEHGPTFSPSRNRIEANRVVDSGAETGVAVDIEGVTEAVVLTKNVLLETRLPAARVGVRISKEAKNIQLAENRIDGFSTNIVDLGKR